MRRAVSNTAAISSAPGTTRLTMPASSASTAADSGRAGDQDLQRPALPTMFIAHMDHPEFDRFDLTSLRTGIMAGSALPDRGDETGDPAHTPSEEVTIAYGMTETSPVSFQSRTDDPLERRVTTVGRLLPHLEAKVVDAEGRIVPASRRASDPRLFGDARLLGPTRSHRRGD